MEQIIFELMRQGKKVQITKEFRKYWERCQGRWFDIMCYNADDTVTLQDQYHTSFSNVPVGSLIISE